MRWQVASRRVMASWASIHGAPESGPVPLDGTYEWVADLFTKRDSPRRFVLLGEPGAGKSMLALHLTVKLLRLRAKGEPVPVLLQVAGWDPAQPLDDWIADQLAMHNRALARLVQAPDGTRRTLAREWVFSYQILPILDGFDEIDPAHQAAALRAVASAVGVGRQFVLTSRTSAYEAAVTSGRSLPTAAVIEIQPLDPVEVAQYLLDGTDQSVPRWNSVVDLLTTEPDSPLARALSTPLMTWLARAVYHNRKTDPSELLTAAWATSRASIEKHLLDRLISTVYTTAVSGYPARNPAVAKRVHRYLAWLAHHLHHRHTYDLAWWQLDRAFHPLLPVLMVGFAIGIPLGISCGLYFGAHYGLVAGLTAGVIGLVVGNGSVAKLGKARSPHQVKLRFINPTGFHLGLYGGLFVGLLTGLQAGAFVGLLAGLVGALVIGLATGFSRRTDGIQIAVTPASLLVEDRQAALVNTLVFSLVSGLTSGVLHGIRYGPTGGIMGGIALGLIVGLQVGCVYVWSKFVAIRALLALYRRGPLRLMTFLKEAHRRGILRQAGGVYQFRHNHLQDHLAAAGPQQGHSPSTADVCIACHG